MIEFHENDSLRLYDLSNDIGEQNDLSARMPEKAAALRDKLHRWRESIDAQMPTRNPDYDPDRETQVAKRKR